MRNFFKNLIRFYKIFLSPLFGEECRYYPSCSTYALEAFEILPLGQAFGRVLKRILSCHPFHPGGVDFVTKEKI